MLLLTGFGKTVRFHKGALIVTVNGQNVRSAQDFDAFLQKVEADLEQVILEVKSSHGREKITMKLSN